MSGLDNMSKEKLKEVTSKGGKARWESNKTIEDVVREQINNQVLKDLVKGMIDSGKKGNVKAVETLLKYLEPTKEKPTTIEEFLDNEN